MTYAIRIIVSNTFYRVLSVNNTYTLNRLIQVRTISSLNSQCTKCNQSRSRYVKNTCFKAPNLSLYSCSSGLKVQHLVSQRRTYASDPAVSKSDLHSLFPLRFIYIRTNVTFWEEYPEGILFDVGYVDTKLRKDTIVNDRMPVILGLPSPVGTHEELMDVLMTFAKLGYRVVIPNLPGSSLCRGKLKQDEAVCQFTVQEQADFVKDFVKELGIEKVDMLVTNSVSGYTGVSLCVFHTSLFKSLVMINPTGLEPTKAMLPLRYHKTFTRVFDERFILQGLFKYFVAVGKIFTKKRHWKTINIVTFSRTIAALSFSDEKVRAEYLNTREIPRFAIFGEDSKTFDTKSTLEYLPLINIPESAITKLDERNKIVKKGTPCDGNYAVHIQGEKGEDILKTRTVVLRKELLKILKTIRPDL